MIKFIQFKDLTIFLIFRIFVLVSIARVFNSICFYLAFVHGIIAKCLNCLEGQIKYG